MDHNFGYFEEDEFGDLTDKTLWKRIASYGKPQWKGILGAILLSMLAIGTSLALPHLVRLAIDNYIVNNDLSTAQRLEGLGNLSMLFITVIFFGFVANFFQVTLLEWTGQNIMHRLRQHLYTHMLELDIGFFNDNPSGKLVTRLTNDIQNMHEMFTSVIITLFNDFLQVAGILVLLYTLNWKLALLLTLMLPLIAINTYLFSYMARRAFRDIRTHLAKINAFLQESLSGMALIQLFRREGHTMAQFEEHTHQYFDRTFYQIKIFGIFLPMIEVFSSAAIALIIWKGGSQVLEGNMTLGVLTAFISYMRLFFKPARELAQKYSIVQSALASAERIFETLDRRSSLPVELMEPSHAPLTGEISFQNISFAYKKGSPVLKDFSVEIKPGDVVAIVGATGSGKTTIINLLERLYDPDQGTILLQGRNLRTYNLHWLRNQIGLVMQDVLILPATIRDNILFHQQVDEARLNEVLEMSQMTEVVRRLPDGLNTRIGDGGHELSAGQKQLLSLARVLVREPKILILDEATSNIDSATEMLLEKAVAASLSERTGILIAHRLSTIRNAGRIIVLDGGKIVEQGSHDSLIAAKGDYWRMIQLQQMEKEQQGKPAPNGPTTINQSASETEFFESSRR